ncbi:TetR/AcrR family transcriptional regulator [Ancrocorticia sp.]|uniref:TetR/AcrR family transcriptional regulator n=1 Tax=Ancrocorticia sp. TaxID=2593684 RepID=UPI003F8E95FE
MSTERIDPRFQRSHDAIAAVMLELAAQVPAEQITVRDLAQAAGVSRQTFYRHASSPVEFLSGILIEDMHRFAPALVGSLSDPSVRFEDAWRALYSGMLDHVNRFAPVYQVMVSRQSTAFNAINNWFVASGREFIRDAIASSAGTLDDTWIELAAQQQAGNVSAIMKTWILEGMTKSPEYMVNLFMTLAPPWQLARRNESGKLDFPTRRHGT